MTMVFGLVPAVLLVKQSIGAELRSGERGSSRTARGIYQGLVVSEVALACALLVGSVLLIRTVREMTAVRLGVEAETVVVSPVQISAGAGTLDAWRAVEQKHTEILERIRQSPGVTSAGATNFLPLDHGWRNPVVRGDAPPVPAEQRPQAQMHVASDGYFETDGRDDRVRPRVHAAGHRRHRAGRHRQRRVREAALSGSDACRRGDPDVDGAGRPARPQLHVVSAIPTASRARSPGSGSSASSRTFRTWRSACPWSPRCSIRRGSSRSAPSRSRSPRATPRRPRAALKNALKAVSPNTPVGKIETWGDRFRARTAEPRLLMTTLTMFGGLAAFLAALGVYGLFSWSVALRQRELAIRLTLGAKPSGVAVAVIRHCAVLAIVGLTAGLIVVQLAKGALATVVFGVTPGDITSMAVAATLLLATAVLASLLPAWRATRVNPVEGCGPSR